MGRINSNVGLITGISITDTVNQLLALAAKPRDMVQARTDKFKAEQVAVTQLTALLLSTQVNAKKLGDAALYDQKTVQSLDAATLKVTANGEPSLGTYQFTPLQQVQAQQLLSDGVASDTAPLGEGKVTFRFGGFINADSSLALLNGGEGLARGKIRITDRSGVSTEIDLRYAQTVDDVLNAINSTSTINVRAQVSGDAIQLVDQTGQTTSNLKVQEIGSGKTAASLGIAAIDSSTGTATGSDVLKLFGKVSLDRLNGPNGVRFDEVLPDIEVKFRDGSTSHIDFKHLPRSNDEEDKPANEQTLEDVLATINAVAPDKLRAEIAPDGDRLLLTDLTEGGHAFKLSSEFNSKAIADLGLDGASDAGVITGRRLLGGLKSTLLSTLDGGRGVGELGAVNLTDRSGAQATVNLAGAESVDDVIARINAAGVGIQASVNAARNGIQLSDTTGLTAGKLIVASGDDKGTAEKLKLAIDAEASQRNSGSLSAQTLGAATRLSSLNGGKGVADGLIRITDARGGTRTVGIASATIQTVGDLIETINNQGLDIEARLNDAGDGVLLVSTNASNGSIRVQDLNSTAAADLHIAGQSAVTTIGTVEKQAINGTTTFEIALNQEMSLADLVDEINTKKVGVAAGKFNDGGALNPFHLTLLSQRPGRAGELMIDTSELGLRFEESSAAQDAKLLLGAPSATGVGPIVTGTSNVFKDVVPGLTLEALNTSDTAVTVTVNGTNEPIIAAAQAFVDSYNALHKKLKEVTAYNTETQKGGILLGDSSALHIDTDFASLLSGRVFGVGDIQSLEEVGLELKDDGTLSLDKDKLRARQTESPEGVQAFFQTKDLGLAAKIDKLIEGLAGEDDSILVNRAAALERKIQVNDQRVKFFNEFLTRKRDVLLNQFYTLESTIAKIQANTNALGALNALANPTA
ncbi:MAG: flagellar filament capping protein FliD [Planctomycetia bacterium]|nr:flagellar filament capping protein FliD [Planctomycetia bacterium]